MILVGLILRNLKSGVLEEILDTVYFKINFRKCKSMISTEVKQWFQDNKFDLEQPSHTIVNKVFSDFDFYSYDIRTRNEILEVLYTCNMITKVDIFEVWITKILKELDSRDIKRNNTLTRLWTSTGPNIYGLEYRDLVEYLMYNYKDLGIKKMEKLNSKYWYVPGVEDYDIGYFDKNKF